MSASNEWDEWHLTPKGWVEGTEKMDHATKEVSPPANRVATFRFTAYLASAYSRMSYTWDETWRAAEAPVDALLKQFGKYPSKYIEDRLVGKPLR